MRSLPIRKDDEVQIVRGKHAKEAVAKVTTVYRRRYCIHVDRIIKENCLFGYCGVNANDASQGEDPAKAAARAIEQKN